MLYRMFCVGGACGPPPPFVAPFASSLRTHFRGDPPLKPAAAEGRFAPGRAAPPPLASSVWCPSLIRVGGAMNVWFIPLLRIGGALRAPRPRSLLRSQAHCALTSGATPRLSLRPQMGAARRRRAGRRQKPRGLNGSCLSLFRIGGALRAPAPVRRSARTSLRTHFRGDPPPKPAAADEPAAAQGRSAQGFVLSRRQRPRGR